MVIFVLIKATETNYCLGFLLTICTYNLYTILMFGWKPACKEMLRTWLIYAFTCDKCALDLPKCSANVRSCHLAINSSPWLDSVAQQSYNTSIMLCTYLAGSHANKRLTKNYYFYTNKEVWTFLLYKIVDWSSEVDVIQFLWHAFMVPYKISAATLILVYPHFTLGPNL